MPKFTHTMKQYIPNLLTIIRLVLAFVLIGLLIAQQYWLVFWLFLFAVVTDFLDGWLARKWKVKSDFGAKLDPLVDKLVILLPLGFLTYTLHFSWFWFLLIVVREGVITLIREKLSKKGVSMPADMHGKIKTTLQFCLVLVLLLHLTQTLLLNRTVFETIYFGVAFYTAWSGLLYLKKLKVVKTP